LISNASKYLNYNFFENRWKKIGQQRAEAKNIPMAKNNNFFVTTIKNNLYGSPCNIVNNHL
jgi:hypothetical protein